MRIRIGYPVEEHPDGEGIPQRCRLEFRLVPGDRPGLRGRQRLDCDLLWNRAMSRLEEFPAAFLHRSMAQLLRGTHRAGERRNHVVTGERRNRQ